MAIDIICLILILIGLFKGYRKGFVVAVFSFFAFFIGIAVALKFSVVVSQWLHKNTNVGMRWLPFLSFILVIIIVAMLIRWAALLIQGSLDMVMLGWLNKLAGIFLYISLYLLLLSILLFYAFQLQIISSNTIEGSHSYPYLKTLGPKAINGLGTVVPIFKDLFTQLETFFSDIAPKATPI